MIENNWEQTALALLAELPRSCDTIVDAFTRVSRELKEAREELLDVHSERTTLKSILEIVFNLLEETWAMIQAHGIGRDMKTAGVQREGEHLASILDLAIMQLDLQSIKIDCDALRRENMLLRRLVYPTEASADHQSA